MSKINPVKQKQQKEKFARKINPCYGHGRIVIRNVHLEGKNALIVAKRSQANALLKVKK